METPTHQNLIKDKPKNEDLRYGSRAALLAMAEIAALGILKAVVGYSTGMIVLVADGLTSLSDMLSLFASYIGLKISQRRPDKNFKYGYYKAESFAAFLAAILIIYLGAEILKESVERLFILERAKNHLFGLGQIIVTVVVSLHLAHYLEKAGKKVNSLSLVNSGKEKRADLISQIAVFAGIGASYFQIPYLEGIMGILLSLVILKVGITTSKESIFFLLDYFDNPKLIEKIQKIIQTKSKIVKKITDIRLRRAGTYIFGEAFLEINPLVDARDIRNDMRTLKEKIARTDRHLKDFLLFFEVPHTHRIRVAVPVQDDKGLKSTLAASIEQTRFYVFVDIEDTKILDFYSKPFPFQTFDLIGISQFLKNENAGVVVNNNMHSLLFYNLKRLQHILVYPQFLNVTDVENTIKLLLIDT